MVCRHLEALERALLEGGFPATYRGRPWTQNCREWVYFDCVLDVEAVRARFAMDECVRVHQNPDQRSGTERGFLCDACHDAVMGRLEGAPAFPREEGRG